MKHCIFYISLILLTLLGGTSCRQDDVIFIPEHVQVAEPTYSAVTGFYLLNEGNMGMNKCTLDYYDYASGVYTRNIYGAANPSVPKELGDVGNDIAIYGSRLYAVINASNKVEVMRASDATRIGQIEIANCRRIAFKDGYAYVTSYAGPIVIDPEYKQRGYVAKIDTATMQVVDKCLVGYQPDGIAIAENRIYVANSGGYMVPNYENTISVIDLASFTEVKREVIDINLENVIADSRGRLWISSRGDYENVKSRLFCYDLRKERLEAAYDIPVGQMTLCGDSLYIVSNAYSNITQETTTSFALFDIEKCAKVSDMFITDGTNERFSRPYSVNVNPLTKEIFVSDAKNYVTPGTLYCFSPQGVCLWSVRTGDIPAHIVFTGDISY